MLFVAVFVQQISDGVAVVELSHWVNVVWPLCTLGVAFSLAAFALLRCALLCDLLLTAAELHASPDAAFLDHEIAFTALKVAVVELWLACVIAAGWRHIGQINRLACA